MKRTLIIGLLAFMLHGAAANGDQLYGERSAVSLGRLFLTAEQRQSLDARRGQADRSAEGSDSESATPKPARKKTTSYGLISSGDGAPLIWKDGGFRPAARERVPTEARESTADTASQDHESAE